jgi:hypothetical protein
MQDGHHIIFIKHTFCHDVASRIMSLRMCLYVLLIAVPSTFAKLSTFQVCLEALAIALAGLSTFA